MRDEIHEPGNAPAALTRQAQASPVLHPPSGIFGAGGRRKGGVIEADHVLTGAALALVVDQIGTGNAGIPGSPISEVHVVAGSEIYAIDGLPTDVAVSRVGDEQDAGCERRLQGRFLAIEERCHVLCEIGIIGGCEKGVSPIGIVQLAALKACYAEIVVQNISDTEE